MLGNEYNVENVAIVLEKTFFWANAEGQSQ